MPWTLSDVFAILIVFVILFIIYAKIRNQSLRETWEEVKEVFVPE